ncbi:hypothetical protein ANN_00934 [Periplaneta americana]|uniref:Reverse transcriptase domain-containing protein n=1 Tax=Periplaneta americana TaxID=6978 RepID=A0ABQ8TS55_PERAM|nr:hypothetical protein ANN_00934 [Periplaneta americana]
MAGLYEGGNEPSGSLKAICKPGYSSESKITSLIQDLSDDVDRWEGRIDGIVIDFAKAFDVVPHEKLLDNPVVRWRFCLRY